MERDEKDRWREMLLSSKILETKRFRIGVVVNHMHFTREAKSYVNFFHNLVNEPKFHGGEMLLMVTWLKGLGV